MIEITNPATDETIDRLESDTVESIAAKLDAGRESQPEWESTKLQDRLDAIESFASILRQQRGDLASALTAETGKPIAQSAAEISDAADDIDALVSDSGRTPRAGKISWRPIGTIAIGSTWTNPYRVAAGALVPALLAGNAVLYKPHSFASLIGLAISDLMWEAGVPPNVLHTVIGTEPATEGMVARELDSIVFFGTPDRAREVAAAVWSETARTHFHLHGLTSAYVSDDADIDAAAERLARAAFEHNGQSETAVDRIYVHDEVCDAFVRALSDRVRAFRVDDPAEETTDVGPVIQKRRLGPLELAVADAVQRGGELHTGGKRGGTRGYFFEPAVVANADHHMRLMQRPLPGPIVGVMRVGSPEEAVFAMRDGDVLSASIIFTENRRLAREMLDRIGTDICFWNSCSPNDDLGWAGISTEDQIAGTRAFMRPVRCQPDG